MKPSRIFWSVLLVAFGTLLLVGRNVDFQVDLLWKFWPLVLVFVGLTMMVKEPRVRRALAGVAGFCAAFLLYGLVTFEWIGPDMHIKFDDDESGDNSVLVQEFTEPLAPAAKHAIFKFEAAAGTYSIDSGSAELLRANIRSSIGRFVLDRESTNDDVQLHLRPERKNIHIGSFRTIVNEVDVRLTPAMLWDVELDIGAAKVDCDLSGLQVQKIDINAGAASLKLKLGVPANETHVQIDAGASTARISVPESVGCEVRIDGGLASKKLVDFEKIRDGMYQTANFAQQQKRIYIDADAGVSSLRVVRY